MQPEKPPSDRRLHPRHEVHVSGTAFVLCQSHIMAVTVSTRNISEGGVLIVSEEELQGERMLVQLSLPQFEGVLVECDVKHRSRFEQLLLSGENRTLHAYGLEFGSMLQMENVHETLLAAFPAASESASLRKTPACSQRLARHASTRESLVPTLSALGLAVVYASQFPWG